MDNTINRFLIAPGSDTIFKGWGYEQIIINTERFCGKILHINKDKKFSWHYHIDKDECFYIKSGKIKLLYGFSHNIHDATSIILEENSRFYIPPRLVHQVIALEDTDIIEFSSHYDDNDSYRIIKGD